jgi:hypothetical protein
MAVLRTALSDQRLLELVDPPCPDPMDDLSMLFSVMAHSVYTQRQSFLVSKPA